MCQQSLTTTDLHIIILTPIYWFPQKYSGHQTPERAMVDRSRYGLDTLGQNSLITFWPSTGMDAKQRKIDLWTSSNCESIYLRY